MSKTTREYGALLTMLLVVTLVLVACGDAASPAATVGPTATTAASTDGGKVNNTFSTAASAMGADSTMPSGMVAPPMTDTGNMGGTMAAGGMAGATVTNCKTTASGGEVCDVAIPAGSMGGMTGTAKVGVILSLSKGAAPYGTNQKNGLELARDEINAMGGVKVELDIQDDASDPVQAKTVMQSMVNNKVVAVIGPTLSNSAFSADPLAQAAGIPVLAISNTADKISGKNGMGEYIFRASLSERQAIPPTIKAAKEKLGFTKAALLYGDDDAFTKSGADVFRQALKDNGVEIVVEETYKKGATDFSGQISNIKAANPEVVVVSALIAEAIPAVKQMRDASVTLPIIGGNGFNNPRIYSADKGAGTAAEGVIVGAAWNIASDNPKSAEFITKYNAKYGSNPDQFAAQAYDGLYILHKAMSAGSDMSGAVVSTALRDVQYDGVLGSFKFNADQDPDMSAVVQIVQGGKFAVYK